ncbi:hypothetical protein OG2516_07907 [Oceanicola granulosus HTCC2516]|uniref:Cation/multidrug efflux pump n=1 Tax=Oceanicola granulosus (strain ATCC BAA-861 / DSM 15982 / KCTC 12143 / HTCC2516) TaxID=314256 RepID=Q2CI73_OCEGH|nr:hypothetical protein [Oceanicola granulosus]EAR52385.1 hypothetical protein OG2516_07907 [Oceanicola granulosus HTCC2516]
MQFIRLLIFGLLALTVVYVCVSLYSRSVRREKLEERWDAAPEGDAVDREAYIARGMEEYERSLRKRLILLVYVVPVVTVASIIYLIN